MKKNRFTSITLALSVIIVLFASIFQLQTARLQQVKSSEENNQNQKLEQEDLAKAAQLRSIKEVPSLGFQNIIADWTFLNFLQYFGDDVARESVGYQVSPSFFEVIINRDPFFFLPYVFLSSSTSLYAAQPQTTVALIEQGLTHMTPQTPLEAAVVWRYKAVDELLFLGKPETAKQSYETAAEWAEQSPDPAVQATAAASRQTAQFIAENPDSRRTLIAGWSQILGQAIDENTFNLAVQQVEALGGSVVRTEDGGISVQIPENLDQQTP